MSALPGPNNPIVYAQFRLQGGWRGVAVMVGTLVLILGAMLTLNGIAAAAGGASIATVMSGWPQGLVMLQVLFLLIIAPLRVSGAIRADVTNRMIESHRLMPLSPAGAVGGYVVGGPWAALVLAASTLGFGTVCCVVGGVNPGSYLLANGVLLAAATVLCIATAHLSMVSRLGILLLVFLIPVGLMGQSNSPGLMPACGVLSAPLIARSALVLRGTEFTLDAWGYALIGQAAIAAICFRAAVRLYRTPGCIGLSPALGLLLLMVWVALSSVGLTKSELFSSQRGFHPSNPDPASQLVASIVAALLIAALPVAAAARMAVQPAADAGDGPTTWVGRAGRARLLPAVVLLAATVFVVALPAFTLLRWPPTMQLIVSADQRWTAMAVTLAVVAAQLAGLTCLFGSAAYGRVGKAWLIAAVWLIITWVVPLIVDFATSLSTDHGPGPIASISPIGALTIEWTQSHPAVPLLGIAAQWVVAATAGVLMLAAVLASRRADGVAGQGLVVGLVQPGESGSKIVGSRDEPGVPVEADLGIDLGTGA
jgi:hypothetical protein